MADANKFTITLAIDGMYYHEAKRMQELAAARDKEFIETQTRVSATKKDFLNKLNDPSRGIGRIGKKEADDFSSELHSHWQPVELATTELIRTVATAHMLCAASLEAHINIRAENLLKRRDFEEFDKLSIAGKWLFYPILKGVAGRFDPGAQPFQKFPILIKRRNALVHYKEKKGRVKTYDPYEVPSFVQELGLRAAAADESLSTVREMITALAKMENRDVPEWIDGDSCLAFEWA